MIFPRLFSRSTCLGILVLAGCRPATPIAPAPTPTPSPSATPASPTTSSLKAGYTRASESLAVQLCNSLAKPSTQDRLLATARAKEATCKKVEAICARRFGAKFAPEPGETLVGVVLQTISTETPTLTEDKPDLLMRYKSSLKLHLKIDKPSTADDPKKEGMFSIDLDIPVAADPDGTWSFPTVEAALDAIAKRCDGNGEFFQYKEEQLLEILKS